MTDYDAFRIMSRETAGRLLVAWLIFCACVLTAPRAHAYDDIRLEAAGGRCQHHMAADASWSYREWGNYETNMNTKPGCYQIGVSWLPHWKGLGDARLGLRLAYVNLGTITAHNTFPIDEPEYFRAKEQGRPVNSAISEFNGHGNSKGFTMGLASEIPVSHGLSVGPEAGVAVLYSRWKAYFPNKEEEIYGCGIGWACADGWHGTFYVGTTARYQWLFLSARRYLNVHASQASKNPLYIGPTTGPVNQVVIGISIPL